MAQRVFSERLLLPYWPEQYVESFKTDLLIRCSGQLVFVGLVFFTPPFGRRFALPLFQMKYFFLLVSDLRDI